MNDVDAKAPVPPGSRPRLADVVFGLSPPGPSWRLPAAVVVAIGVHAVMTGWALNSEQSLGSWAAAIATRVHAELSREEVVDVAKPPPAPPKVAEPPPTAAITKVRIAVSAKSATPPPPAQAGAIVAQDVPNDAPVDLTGETFVTGIGSAYAGGITTSRGTGKTAAQKAIAIAQGPRSIVAPAEPDRSSLVTLDDQDWSCPWPREADAEEIDEQTVVIRVEVQTDGSVQSASILSDPGHGFGDAAVACAKRTRFAPARDRQGHVITAKSPPLRVRFLR